jgi:hypothetical protein
MARLYIIILLLITSRAFCGGSKQIARVDENGNIIFDRNAYFTVDVYDVEISKVDGAIYVSCGSDGFGKFDENGYLDQGFSFPDDFTAYDFDIDSENYLWIPGSGYPYGNGLYKYSNTGNLEFAIADFAPHDVSANDSPIEIWVSAHSVHEEYMPGMHKFDADGTRLLYLDEYWPYWNSTDINTGEVWFMDFLGYSSKLVKLDTNGDELVCLRGVRVADPQASPVDGGCWFISGGGLIKVDTYGSIIFRDSSFNEIAAIDVNESDGSVWVASNIPKRLVHLDKDGNRQLYKEWPGGDFAHLAVDQRNGTCIVIYEEYRSGAEMNIQPASVGEIKAMYAE